MPLRIASAVPILCSLLALLPATSAEEVDRGLLIARETDRRDAGFGDWVAEAEMILRNAEGQESVRNFRMLVLEVSDDGDKTLSIFDRPRDIAGTAILTWSHGLEPDDQWIYLPALGRTKRISSSNKSGPFMGSEFAYEDIAAWQVEKYDYRFVEETVLDGDACFLVENTPRYEHSGYARQLEWVDATIYQPRRIDFYDRKNELLKTLRFSDYSCHLDRHWRAARLEMVNHQTGKSTLIDWSPYRFATGLGEGDFTPGGLRRAR